MGEGVRLKDKKRRAILRAGAEVFHAQGFDNASMDCIAETAQVSKRTVYNHFASKDALFTAIVRHLQESPLALQQFHYDSQRSLADQLSEIARCIIAFHCAPESRCLCRVIVSRLLQSPQLAQELFAGGRIFESSLIRWMEAAKQEGRLVELDTTFGTRQFLGLLETFTLWPQLLKGAPDPSADEVTQIVTSTVRMFLARHAGLSAGSR